MAQTVLLLVPDLFFQARLETAARRMNFRVVKAADWKSALDLAKKGAPSGAVVDLGAPASTGGFRFLEKAKADKSLAGMKSLGFVDHVRTDLAEKARKAGCSTVVTKNALSLDTPGYLRRLMGPVVTLAPAKPEKPEKPEKAEKPDRPDRPEKPAKAPKPERPLRAQARDTDRDSEEE
jgi:DNA-binding NarL/FixJ family response regulator